MENDTVSFYFNLTMFVNIGHYRYPTFLFCLLLYSFIVFANLVIILVISREKTLQEPMYLFIAMLSVNSLYGSSGFFPRFLVDLLSDTHLHSRPACFTQIYVIYTYACYEMTLLSVIAYDRYIAICHPLHYHRKMTSKSVSKLAAFAWIYPAFGVMICISLSIRLPLCGNEIQKVFCANWNIVKLSCVTTVLNNIYGLILTITTAFFPLSYILYTYLRIVLVCWKSSAEFRGKVLHSCLPHIISIVIYSMTAVCDITLSRYDIEEINPFVAVTLALEFVVIPPLLNPLVYGLKLPEIKRHTLSLLSLYKIIS